MKLSKLIILLFAIIMNGCNAKAEAPLSVSPKEFQSMLAKDAGAWLLDVRKPDEFEAGHLIGAHQLNWLDEDAFKREALNIDKSKTIYAYCRSGRRSAEAANWLSQQGYKVVDMEGGFLAWQENGLPVEKASSER